MKAWLFLALVDLLLFTLYSLVYVRHAFRRLLRLDQ
jgi:hypothetical protein